jgi:hypothetical protein
MGAGTSCDHVFHSVIAHQYALQRIEKLSEEHNIPDCVLEPLIKAMVGTCMTDSCGLVHTKSFLLRTSCARATHTPLYYGEQNVLRRPTFVLAVESRVLLRTLCSYRGD